MRTYFLINYVDVDGKAEKDLVKWNVGHELSVNSGLMTRFTKLRACRRCNVVLSFSMIYFVDFDLLRVSDYGVVVVAAGDPLQRNVKIPKIGSEYDGSAWQLNSKSLGWVN